MRQGIGLCNPAIDFIAVGYQHGPLPDARIESLRVDASPLGRLSEEPDRRFGADLLPISETSRLPPSGAVSLLPGPQALAKLKAEFR